MSLLEKHITEPKIAYFSMEIGLRDDIPTYSGGLGILAGDTVKSAARLTCACLLWQSHSSAGRDISGRNLTAGDTRRKSPLNGTLQN